MSDLLALTLMSAHPAEAAQALEPLDPVAVAGYFATLPDKVIARVLLHLTPNKQVECVKALADSKAIAVLPLLPIPLCAQLLRQLERSRRKALLQAFPLAIATALKVVQRYPQGTVGSIMDPFTPTLPQGLAVDEALKRLRAIPQTVPHHLFITDRSTRLQGRVSTSDLLLASRKSRVDDLLQRDGPVFVDHTLLEQLEQHPAWINVTLIPVVDRKGVLLGALSQSRLSSALNPANGSLPPPAPSPSRRGFMDLADGLWSLLARLLEPAGPARQPRAESAHEE